MPLRLPDHGSLVRVWRWHLQLLAERLFSRIRIVALVGTALWWAVAPHPASSHVGAEWVVLIACALFCLVNEWVLRNDLAIARVFPIGAVLADFAIIAAGIWASGGRQSPFQFFIVVGVASASLRLPIRPAFLSTIAYIALSLTFGDLDSTVPDAALVLMLGVGIAAWSETVMAQHIAAVRDPLTGAYSRDFGLLQLQEAMEKKSFPFAIATVDIDRFKGVNDVHGHAAGDSALRHVARTIMSVLRPDDVLCRFGGDEYLIVLRDVDARLAAMLGERIRAAIESSPLALREERVSISVTLSIGLAVASRVTSIAELLKSSDTAMYAAKKRRNAVVVSGEGEAQPLTAAKPLASGLAS